MSKYIKITAPKQVFDLKALDVQLDRLVHDVGKIFEAGFAESVRDFNHKPPIRSAYSNPGGNYAVTTTVSDENYARLNNGTKDHLVGQPGKRMSFHGYPKNVVSAVGGKVKVYNPKTHPGSIPSTPGGPIPTGKVAPYGPWRVKGIKPRKYDELILKRESPKIIGMARRAFANAIDISEKG